MEIWESDNHLWPRQTSHIWISLWRYLSHAITVSSECLKTNYINTGNKFLQISWGTSFPVNWVLEVLLCLAVTPNRWSRLMPVSVAGERENFVRKRKSIYICKCCNTGCFCSFSHDMTSGYRDWNWALGGSISCLTGYITTKEILETYFGITYKTICSNKNNVVYN